MKYGVCAWSLPMTTEESFAYANKMGLDGISIGDGYKDGIIPLLDKSLQEHYLQLSKDNHVEIIALAINSFCDFGMSKVEKFETVKYIFESAVSIAKSMNITVIQVPSFFDGEIRCEEDLLQTIKCLEYGVSLLEGTGIELGYENALSYEDNMRICEIMKGKPYFIYFDTQNPLRYGEIKNPEVLAAQLMPYIKQMHVKDSYDDDSIPLQLGEGNTHFNETIAEFIKAEYKGWVIMESEYRQYENYTDILAQDITMLKNLFK